MIIKYGNTDITNLILEYKRKGSIDDETVFLLGNVPSYQIDLKLDNESGILQTLQGDICEYDTEGKLKGTYFIYEAPEKYTSIVKLTCFDKMLFCNIAYDSKLTYPTTIKDQLDEISNLTGLFIYYVNLPERVLSQEVNWWDNTISCRNYIGWIAEVAGMNAFANETGTVVFKELSITSDWKTEDVEDYEIEGVYMVSKVCFDNGLLRLEHGNDDGNKLYLSANNPYIDTEHNPVEYLYNKYKGLRFTSVSKLKCGGLDDLKVFDIIEYQNMKFMCLDITSSYKGGIYQIQDVKGNLVNKNADKVTEKFDDTLRLKKLEVIMNQNEQTLKIIAKEVEDQNEKLTKFEQDLNGFSLTVSETTEKVETIENAKRYHIELSSSKGTAFKNNEISTSLSVKIFSWDNDISSVVSDETVRWTRMSTNVVEDNAWKRTGKNIEITSSDLNDFAVFIAKWNGIEARISLVNVSDGAQGKDAILILADSSNGMSFKNSQIATTLTLSVIMGDRLIDSYTKLVDVFGNNAKIYWQVKNMHETEFVDIPIDDPRISDNGFIFTVSAKDVKTKAVFNFYLDY